MAIGRALPLEERIRKLREEIDAIVDARVDETATDSPGIPKEVLRQMLTARATGCQCSQYLQLTKESAA